MIRILHVDDDESVLDLTKIYLEKMGRGKLEVDSLDDPRKLFEFIQEKEYDCIVCDYQMPHLDGLELLDQIRRKHITIPFIIFTGRGREEVAIQALNLGANRYIKKGGEPKSQFGELLHSIKAVVDHDRTERALYESERKSRAMLRAIPSYIFVFDENGVFLSYEGALTEQIGDVDQLPGRNISELVDEDTSLKIKQKIKAALQTGETQHFFYELPINDRTNYFDGRVVAYGDNTVLTISHDITELKKVEKMLRKEKDRLQNYLDIASVMFLVLDKNGAIELINGEGCQILDDTYGEILGKNWFDNFIPEQEREEKRAIFAKLMRGEIKSLEDFEGIVVSKKGEKKVISWKTTPIRDETGRITGVLSSGEDITERKKAEMALRESEEKFRTLTESSLVGVTIIQDDEVKYVNEARAAITGYSKEELERSTAGEILKTQFHPEDVEFASKQLMKKQTGETDGVIPHYSVRMITKTGEIKWVDIFSRTVMFGGKPADFITIVDITDRKRAEEALRLERDRVNKYLDVAGTIIVAVNERGEVILINRKGREILGYKEEEIIGKNYFQTFIPERFRERLVKNFQKVFTGEIEPSHYYENPVLTRDGKVRMIAWYNTVLTDDSGKIIATLSSGEDITERKRAEEALRESEKKYHSLVSNIPAVTWITDSDGHTSFISSNIENIYGYTPEDIYRAGESIWFGRIHPDDQERVKENYQSLFEGKKKFDVEYRIKRKEGQWIWLHDRAISTYEKGGKMQAYGVFSDITARKQAEEALKLSEERFRMMAENIQDGLSIVEDRGVRELVYVNGRLCEITGYTREEILEGMKSMDIVAPESRTRLGKFFQDYARGIYPEEPVEIWIIAKDGSHHCIKNRYSYKFLEEEGKKVIIEYCITTDITESKQAEKEMAAAGRT